MRKNLLVLTLMMVRFAVSASSPLQIIGAGTASIFQPILSEDTIQSQKISLLNQQIKFDVFQGYVIVRADYWFNNSSDTTIYLLAGLPLCKNPVEANCSELYWLRIMINNGAPQAASVLTNDSLIQKNLHGQKISAVSILHGEKYPSWQTWGITFLPGVTEVSLNYGVNTSDAKLMTGKDSMVGNAFRYSFSNYQWWNSVERGEIWLRMNDGYVTKDILGLLPDKKFLAGNSIVHGTMKDVMNDSAHEILLWYRKLDDAPIIPSHVNWEAQFYKVNDWVVNEKIIATLSTFSATDYEGKAFQHEVQSTSALLQWSVIASVILVIAFLLLFYLL